MRRNTTIIAAAFLATCAMLNAAAHAQVQTVDVVRIVPLGSATSFGLAGSLHKIVILRDTGETVTIPLGAGVLSGDTRLLYDAVVIQDQHASAAFQPVTRIQVGLSAPIAAGTRLGIAFGDSHEACLDENYVVVGCYATFGFARFAVWISDHEVVKPRNSSPLLFTSPARATGDSIGVITGQQDEDGFADLVLTTRGQKPVFATLWTDDPLEPADRIVDIIELDYDPETGLTLYGGFVQY